MLHSRSVYIEAEVLLPIMRDVVQGMRFLHAAAPSIVHADLKSGNVLVDSSFRAKVRNTQP